MTAFFVSLLLLSLVIGVAVLGFTPTNAVFKSLITTLAGQGAFHTTATDKLKVGLIKAPFTKGGGLALADLTEADFPGYARAAVSTGSSNSSTDPATGDSVMTLANSDLPVGYYWEPTGAVSPAQTIYGFFITDAAGTTLLGCDYLPQGNVVLTDSDQSVSLPNPVMHQIAGSLV